jgi:hypothetical protein
MGVELIQSKRLLMPVHQSEIGTLKMASDLRFRTQF